MTKSDKGLKCECCGVKCQLPGRLFLWALLFCSVILMKVCNLGHQPLCFIHFIIILFTFHDSITIFSFHYLIIFFTLHNFLFGLCLLLQTPEPEFGWIFGHPRTIRIKYIWQRNSWPWVRACRVMGRPAHWYPPTDWLMAVPTPQIHPSHEHSGPQYDIPATPQN